MLRRKKIETRSELPVLAHGPIRHFISIGPVRNAILTFDWYRKWNVISIAQVDLSVLGLICQYHLIITFLDRIISII